MSYVQPSTPLTLYMIVNDPLIAQHICQTDGVWPFVDLEYIGKAERQGHVDSWKSKHTPEDVSAVRNAVPDAKMLVRINPMHDRTGKELDDVLARGADAVMLPMFHDADTLVRFYDMLNGRAEAIPLFETAGSIRSIPQILDNVPLTNMHIGLNDLHLDLGLTFMFETLSNGLLDTTCAHLRQANVTFGIGGVSRVSDGMVPAENILGEHVRLGSSASILSRGFHETAPTVDILKETVDFEGEVAKLQKVYKDFLAAGAAAIAQNQAQTADKISTVVDLITSRKS